MSEAPRGKHVAYTPEISVLVPVHNVQKYLREALNSIRTQTLKDFEAICVNDGSADRSRDILHEYAAVDNRFKVVTTEYAGYGATLNFGIQRARGSYIAILDPDDFYAPSALERLLKAAKSSNADVVKANYWLHTEKARAKNVVVESVTDLMVGHAFRPIDEPDVFFAGPSVCSAIYKRSFILGNGLKFLETPGESYQELGFSFKVWARAQRVVCIKDPVLYRRQDAERALPEDARKVFCVCDEFDAIEDFMDVTPNGRQLRPYAYRVRYDSYMWHFERLPLELRARFIDTMVGDLARGMRQGDYLPSLFAQHQRQNLAFLLSEPQEFLKLYPEKPTKASRSLYYRRVGKKMGHVLS